MTHKANCYSCSPSNFGFCLAHNEQGMREFVSRLPTSQMERALQAMVRKTLAEFDSDPWARLLCDYCGRKSVTARCGKCGKHESPTVNAIDRLRLWRKFYSKVGGPFETYQALLRSPLEIYVEDGDFSRALDTDWQPKGLRHK